MNLLQIIKNNYDWLGHEPSQRQRANDELLVAIRREYAASRQSYGSPRIHAALKHLGMQVSRKRVARVMRVNGLVGKAPRRKRPVTTQRESGALAAPNLLAQDFTASRPDEIWLADLTYIDTYEGWLYLALVMDLFSRTIVGWSMADHMRAELVEQALLMAFGRRFPGADLLHHSDRGSQYTSTLIRDLLASQHVRVSMSGVGNCYDNAPMESVQANPSINQGNLIKKVKEAIGTGTKAATKTLEQMVDNGLLTTGKGLCHDRL